MKDKKSRTIAFLNAGVSVKLADYMIRKMCRDLNDILSVSKADRIYKRSNELMLMAKDYADIAVHKEFPDEKSAKHVFYGPIQLTDYKVRKTEAEAAVIRLRTLADVIEAEVNNNTVTEQELNEIKVLEDDCFEPDEIYE